MATPKTERIDLGDGLRLVITELPEEPSPINDVSHLDDAGSARDYWYGSSD